MSVVPSAGRAVEGPSDGQLSDVIGLILEKGLVIDVFARVSLVGIEILTIDARVVVASVETYLRFAEAAGRLNLEEATKKPGLLDLLNGVTGATGLTGLTRGATAGATGALEGTAEAVGGALRLDGERKAPIKPVKRRSREERR